MNIRLSLLLAIMVMFVGGSLAVHAQESLDLPASSPFGVFVQQALDYTDGTTSVTPQTIGSQIEATQVGAAYVRTSNKIWLWDASPNYQRYSGSIDDVYAANQGTSDPLQKIGIVWTINNQMYPNGTGTHTDGSANLTMTQYLAKLNDMLTVYLPSVVQIENEELVSKFYASSASDYLLQLAQAITAVHSHNGTDGTRVKICDGALDDKPAILLTYGNFYTNNGATRADSYGAKVFDPSKLEGLTIGGVPVIHDIWLDSQTTGEPNKPSGLTTGQSNSYDTDVQYIVNATTLVNGYASLDLDYVNFHWYNHKPGVTPSDDSAALGSTMAYLRSATGHPVISTEMGNYTQDTSTSGDTAALLNRIVSYNSNPSNASWETPIVIWYDADGDPAVSLHWGDKLFSGGDGGIHLGDVHYGGTSFENATTACKATTHPATCTN